MGGEEVGGGEGGGEGSGRTSLLPMAGGSLAGGIDLSRSIDRVPLRITDERKCPEFRIGERVAMVTLEEFSACAVCIVEKRVKLIISTACS